MLSDFEKGMDCLEDKNYKDAFIYLEKCSTPRKFTSSI